MPVLNVVMSFAPGVPPLFANQPCHAWAPESKVQMAVTPSSPQSVTAAAIGAPSLPAHVVSVAPPLSSIGGKGHSDTGVGVAVVVLVGVDVGVLVVVGDGVDVAGGVGSVTTTGANAMNAFGTTTPPLGVMMATFTDPMPAASGTRATMVESLVTMNGVGWPFIRTDVVPVNPPLADVRVTE